MFQNSSNKKPTRNAFASDSILESLRDLGSGVGKAVTKDVAGKVANDALSSILGTTGKKPSGELKQNQEINIPEHESRPHQRLRTPERRQYQPIKEDQAKLKQEIEAVRQELRALAASMKSLNAEIEKAVDEVPVDPGIYHKNFFERLRSFIVRMKEQVDDSRTWLALSTGKKSKKGYWGKYKKHGTKFGLSSERTAATQSG